MLRYLMGVDDSDSAKSPSTGDLVRRLAELLQVERQVEPQGVTRHQLLVKKQIRYTAHNSAMCILLDAEDIEGVWETARDFLSFESERGSNPGLCLSRWDNVSQDVIAWGRRAKEELLTMEDAQGVASRSRVRMAAIKGEGTGVIGALAAVGLHRQGNDGRFVWLPGLFTLQGTHSVGDIFDKSGIDRVCTLEEVELPIGDIVEVGAWVRPVLRNGQATLYVEQKKDGWVVLDKEHVKNLSS
jgi:hypothetical protein